MRTVISPSAAVRVELARQFLLDIPPSDEVVVIGASRAAADELVRGIARTRRATFGIHRFSLTQLAARLAAPQLASDDLAPATVLGVQAVASRALFEVDRDTPLQYFGPVARTPGFPRALARTLQELTLASVESDDLRGLGAGGHDLAALLDRFDEQFAAASAVERAQFLARATAAAHDRIDAWSRCRVLLLDVEMASAAEGSLVEALVVRAPSWFATVPAGDERTRTAYAAMGRVDLVASSGGSRLDAMRHHLFAEVAPPLAPPVEELELFSAPGEGRECVEIARRILRETRAGMPFDRMAIALRSPQHYAGLLDHALARAGVPAYFERGTKRPHPAGRAFLALLRCAVDRLSARRFAEYLSLGQVPRETDRAIDSFPSSSDEVFGGVGDRAGESDETLELEVDAGRADDAEEKRAFRAPWKWERLLAESRVVATPARWQRRLEGLARECELQRETLKRTESESPRIDLLTRKLADIGQLSEFALPIIRALDAWPEQATWAEWLARFELLAPRVLRHPQRVLRVLADLRPMGAVGPIGLAEATDVLAERLGTVESEPPKRREGRVLVTTPAQLRGRSLAVVFVPALAERLFPQKPREDPLLLDDARMALASGARGARLTTQHDKAEQEKLQLRLALGAADTRLYVSFPTVQLSDGRPRVPSLYALEIWRAMTGRVPAADELQAAAARTSRATLAWPAPTDAADAIDPLEHDLATLRDLVNQPDDRVRGRAQYLLRLNACVRRSVRERYMRSKRGWTHWDGLVAATAASKPVLDTQRLGARVYSLSALQRYATCPYQFLLGSIYKLQPPEDLGPLHRLDPLTRGSLFHAVQAAFYRRLKADSALPITPANRESALVVLDRVLEHVAEEQYEQLAPALDRVWKDEISAIRRDLRLWVEQSAHAESEWVPTWFEWSFGLSDAGRDPESREEPVTIDGRFHLRGSIDLIETRANGDLRVTDHKTGKYRGKDGMVVSGGSVLQPVLYSLAVESAMSRPVVEGRLYFATTDGGYRDIGIELTPRARQLGLEALEVVDRAIETGFLAPAPAEKACTWCDFRVVCGATAEHRISRYKSHDQLQDLQALRRLP